MINLNKRVQAVIFDWSGTVVDYGCKAPLVVIMKIFEMKGIPLTVSEANEPMGMLKYNHFQELFKLERVQKEYFKLHKVFPTENTVKEFYSHFQPMIYEILPSYSKPNPGVIKVIERLRTKYNIKIGSTTGFTRDMLDYVHPTAEKYGYKPDFMITSSEVPRGRPFPYMIYANAINLDVYEMDTIIKLGDTAVDIQEGKNAGCWSGGIIEGSGTLNYSLEELQSENPKVLKEKKKLVSEKFTSLKADFIINSFEDLEEQIEKINVMLQYGQKPGKI